MMFKGIKQGCSHVCTHPVIVLVLHFLHFTLVFLCFNFPSCYWFNFLSKVFLDVPITTNKYSVLEFYWTPCSVFYFAGQAFHFSYCIYQESWLITADQTVKLEGRGGKGPMAGVRLERVRKRNFSWKKSYLFRDL